MSQPEQQVPLDSNKKLEALFRDISQRLRHLERLEAPKSTDLISAISQNRNYIINGNFDYWQRATSVTSGATQKAADRFYFYFNDGGFTTGRDTDVPTLSQSDFQSLYSLKIDTTTAISSVDAGDLAVLGYRMVGWDYSFLVGKTVTLSFWVKAVKTGTYCIAFRNNGSDRSYIAEYTISSASTWEKKTVTITLDQTGGTEDYTSSTGLAIFWVVAAGSTYQTTKDAWQSGNYYATSSQVNGADSTSNDFQIAQVKIEVGSSATRFSFYAGSRDREFLSCQHYYCKTYNRGTLPGAISNGGKIRVHASGVAVWQFWKYPISMRTNPTVTTYSTTSGNSGYIRDVTGGADVSSTVGTTGTEGTIMGATSITDQRQFEWHAVADAELY